MNRFGRNLTLAGVWVVAALGGCSNAEAPEDICAFAYTFNDRTYVQGQDVELTAGEPLAGSVGPSSCGGSAESRAADAKQQVAYEIEGLEPAEAVAIGPTPSEVSLFVIFSGDGDMPSEVDDFVRKQAATGAGG